MLGLDSDITDEQIARLKNIGFHWRKEDKERERSELESSNDGRPSKATRKRTIPQPQTVAKKQKVVSRRSGDESKDNDKRTRGERHNTKRHHLLGCTL
mmetsp:Transcript_20660/g.50746  ORF Transcript_20660/g.50746 Transcript_20660/m.50746 type:complete len:98 (-) Transcript_20660:860-1153(-)